MFFCYVIVQHPDLHVLTHSFPTPRCSDLPLVQELPESECTYHNGQPEYHIIDNNHLVSTARSIFHKEDIDLLCDVVRVCTLPPHQRILPMFSDTHSFSFLQPNCPPDDLMRLACFRNDMHDASAVHRDVWETFFQVRNYLMQRSFWLK